MDYNLESTFDFKFTSRAFATGIPTVLTSGTIEIYEDNSTTQITGAETLTVDFDSVVGLNNLRVVATAANGFEAGKSYTAILSVGTVGGVSVVGEVVHSFTINRIVAASVTGAVGSVTGAVGSVTGAVGSVTGAVGSVTGAVGSVTGSVGSVVGHTAQTADHTAGIAAISTVVPDAAGVAATEAEVIAAVGTAQTGDSFARLGAPAGADVSADVAAVKTDTGNLVARITATLFSGITSVAEWLGLIAGKQTGDSTARTEIRATGAGSGTFDETADSNEAISGAGGGGAPTADQNAAAVWDKAQASHTTAGTFGEIATEIAAIPTTAMRGTDSAFTAASGAALNDVAATDIVSGGAINTTGGAVDNVTTVATTTTNTDMRGTDGANTTVPDAAGTAPTAAEIWDEVITKAAHDVSNSAAKYLRLIKQTVSVTESAINDPGAAATTTVFNTDLADADDFWNDALLIFTTGSLAGQSKPILDFANTNGVITLDEALTSAPADNDEFVIASTHVHPITQIQSGLATESKQDAAALINTETRLAELDAANIPADLDQVKTDTTTDIPALIAALNDPTAATIATAVWAEVLEGSLTAKGLQRIILAASAGKLSGAAGTNVLIRNLADDKTRINATVDADGNRSAVTLDATD